MGYIKLNDVNCKDVGLLLRSGYDIPVAKETLENISVLGRKEGDLTIRTGSYPNLKFTLAFTFRDWINYRRSLNRAMDYFYNFDSLPFEGDVPDTLLVEPRETETIFKVSVGFVFTMEDAQDTLGWLESEGFDGYIAEFDFSKYVKKADSLLPSGARIFKDMNEDSEVLGIIPEDKKAYVQEEIYPWTKVDYNGIVGYCLPSEISIYYDYIGELEAPPTPEPEPTPPPEPEPTPPPPIPEPPITEPEVPEVPEVPETPEPEIPEPETPTPEPEPEPENPTPEVPTPEPEPEPEPEQPNIPGTPESPKPEQKPDYNVPVVKNNKLFVNNEEYYYEVIDAEIGEVEYTKGRATGISVEFTTKPFLRLVNDEGLTGNMVINRGVTSSQPLIVIKAPSTGEIIFRINGQEFWINCTEPGTIYLDCEKYLAYNNKGTFFKTAGAFPVLRRGKNFLKCNNTFTIFRRELYLI